MEGSISQGKVTYDLARLMNVSEIKCSAFGDSVIAAMG